MWIVQGHSVAHLFSLLNDCLWYDKLWGPSQRVVTFFFILIAHSIQMCENFLKLCKGMPDGRGYLVRIFFDKTIDQCCFKYSPSQYKTTISIDSKLFGVSVFIVILQKSDKIYESIDIDQTKQFHVIEDFEGIKFEFFRDLSSLEQSLWTTFLEVMFFFQFFTLSPIIFYLHSLNFKFQVDLHCTMTTYCQVNSLSPKLFCFS